MPTPAGPGRAGRDSPGSPGLEGSRRAVEELGFVAAMPNPKDIHVGDELPVFQRATGLHHWNRYAAVNDEFVPIHMDDEAGQEAGYPSAFGMGTCSGPTSTICCATGSATTAASSAYVASSAPPTPKGRS